MEVVVVFLTSASRLPIRDKDAGKRFVEERAAVLKGRDVANWKDEKAEYLKEKPSENPA